MGLFSGKCLSQTRLDGKTAVITGCNTGIGKVTAADFARRGARVIMACRNIDKAEEAAADIWQQISGVEGVGTLVVQHLDLSSLASVRQCAEHLLRTEDKIHLLINNAGIMGSPTPVTEDGFEIQFGVNYLGHLLLTCLLLPHMIHSSPARIVNVSSEMYLFGSICFDEHSDSNFSGYSNSKLAMILFSKELGKRLKGTGVTTYAVHPGVVFTELQRNIDKIFFRGIHWLHENFTSYFIKTAEQGAQTTIYCAVSEETAAETGLYYKDCKKSAPIAKGRDAKCAKRLWDETLKLVGLEDWDPLTAEAIDTTSTQALHTPGAPPGALKAEIVTNEPC